MSEYDNLARSCEVHKAFGNPFTTNVVEGRDGVVQNQGRIGLIERGFSEASRQAQSSSFPLAEDTGQLRGLLRPHKLRLVEQGAFSCLGLGDRDAVEAQSVRFSREPVPDHLRDRVLR